MNENKPSNYDFPDIHHQMISDETRTMSYFRAIQSNAELFKDKIVLDVGSGTGILSMFAARAGAQKVYAVECTTTSFLSEQIILKNKLERIITVIHGQMDKVVIPEKVDIIISEWMGYGLYYENMLPAVLYARDHYLREGGCILPSNANLFISCGEFAEYSFKYIDFWEDCYGFDFLPMKERVTHIPQSVWTEPDQLLAYPTIISSIDLHTCPVQSSFFTSPFRLEVFSTQTMHCFVLWFSVEFDDMPEKVSLSTSPLDPKTHWNQLQLFLDSPIEIKEGDIIEGSIQYAQNPREQSGLTITINFSHNHGITISKTFDFL